MSEDIYAIPKLTKKVRFQTGVKDDRSTDSYNEEDSARIYDNCWAEKMPQDKSQDKSQDESQDDTSEDQQQTASVKVSSEKKTFHRDAALFLGLLCLLLLLAVIVLVVILYLDRNRLWMENTKLQTRYSLMQTINHNLSSERDNLQARYSLMQTINHNLTHKTSQLEDERDHLNATNSNLTKERDELQEQIARTRCPDDWMRFGNSCYFRSTSTKNWWDSRLDCQGKDADLLIISSEEEQRFMRSLEQTIWIGATDESQEDVWRWVNGTEIHKTYWRGRQPDNFEDGEDCAVISTAGSTLYNWNDLDCRINEHFICEKILQ